MQKALGIIVLDAVADNDAEKISPQNPKNASDHRANQPLETYNAQPGFEGHHRRSQSGSHESGHRSRESGQAKRLELPAGNRNNCDENKTNEKQVHQDLLNGQTPVKV